VGYVPHMTCNLSLLLGPLWAGQGIANLNALGISPKRVRLKWMWSNCIARLMPLLKTVNGAHTYPGDELLTKTLSEHPYIMVYLEGVAWPIACPVFNAMNICSFGMGTNGVELIGRPLSFLAIPATQTATRTTKDL
jgi:hypothetical protein